jgi:hypothetical protein
MGKRVYDPTEVVVDTITGEVVKVSDYKGIWYSASLISDAQSCMAKAYGRITKQKQINPGIALINGSAAHSGMEGWLKERKDPIKGYNDYFKSECEKQNFDWKSSEAEEKRLEGERMVAATWERFKSESFLARVDPNLVEAGFKVMRAGRLFVGYLDLLYFKEPGKYNYVDFKTGKYPPKMNPATGSSFELDSDLQFNIYPWASFHSLKLPTQGIWPEYGVWFHMRGKNIGKEEVKHKDGTMGWQTAKKEANKVWQFDFQTRPTPESVEQIFIDTIDPVCGDLEDGRWKRNRNEMCHYCNYFDRAKEKCMVDLPIDGLAERSKSQLSLLAPKEKAA